MSQHTHQHKVGPRTRLVIEPWRIQRIVYTDPWPKSLLILVDGMLARHAVHQRILQKECQSINVLINDLCIYITISVCHPPCDQFTIACSNSSGDTEAIEDISGFIRNLVLCNNCLYIRRLQGVYGVVCWQRDGFQRLGCWSSKDIARCVNVDGK